MAKGMNWGIFSLLAVIAMVLGGVTSFFVFLAKKSAAVSAASVAAAMMESTDRA
jgi:maltodextrin utilization protein YvdJ